MPDARDLCLLADVRALMQKQSSDTTQDALISTLITRASVKIMRDYGREFVPGGPASVPAIAATRTFAYSWADQYPSEVYLALTPYDLQASPAPTINVDTDQTAPVLLSTDEWRPDPLPASQGVYVGLYLLPLNVQLGVVGWRKRQVQVTGNWGFPAIPPEVSQACAETVIHWVTSYPAAHRIAQPDGPVGVVTPRSYPMTAIDLLSSFKRMTVA